MGVVTEGSWGPSTQWHHLQCTIFKIQRVEDVAGYEELEDALQVQYAAVDITPLRVRVTLTLTLVDRLRNSG